MQLAFLGCCRLVAVVWGMTGERDVELGNVLTDRRCGLGRVDAMWY